MLTQEREPKYNVKAWYYKPIYPDLATGENDLEWDLTPTSFMCREANKKRTGLMLLSNTVVTSDDLTIETKSLIDFEDVGKISFERVNPSIENASRIKREGITTKPINNQIGNRFRSNQAKIKVIELG